MYKIQVLKRLKSTEEMRSDHISNFTLANPAEEGSYRRNISGKIPTSLL